MSIPTLDALLGQLQSLGAQRVLCKKLAENDNSKQQVYLGGSFDVLNMLPFGAVIADPSAKRPNLKASLPFSWLSDAGVRAPAPGAQLILYPDYPEVRLSGFLRGCPVAPSVLMRPIPGDQRRFNNGTDGRLLFLAVLSSREIVAYLAAADSAIAQDFERMVQSKAPAVTGVFLDVQLPQIGDTRSQLLARLRVIHAAGWHDSCRLGPGGISQPYAARNGAGYTLEALFGIRPNGRAEPDFMGWELKACGSDRITLMTPEPDTGYYGREGVSAFVRKYGYDRGDDTMYFTGAHYAGRVSDRSRQTLRIRGFDRGRMKMVDVNGGIYLVTEDGTDSAGWSFSRLIEHWGRKHAAAAYVPYEHHEAQPPRYRFTSPVSLGEGTDFSRFLAALADGHVIYDPAPKIEHASTSKPKSKARSQFRIRRSALSQLYVRFSSEPIG